MTVCVFQKQDRIILDLKSFYYGKNVLHTFFHKYIFTSLFRKCCFRECQFTTINGISTGPQIAAGIAGYDSLITKFK